MRGRRLQLAKAILDLGVARALAGFSAPILLIVNYHRIWPSGSVRNSQYDDGVFGPDVGEFRRQMEWLRARTTVLDEEGLLALASGAQLRRGTVYSAVTFDDAYVDCYDLAKPVLESAGIRGIFFVPVGMIDARQLGWWDVAAYVLKRTKNYDFTIAGRRLRPREDFKASIRQVLELFKLSPSDETAQLLDQLADRCGVRLPDKDQQSRELMTWEQIREMRSSGHGIGSHTLSHRVLATLGPAEQLREIRESRGELESRIGRTVHSFAYPVGGPRHFNETSVRYAREAGYSQAFTFNTGIAVPPLQDVFTIPRESADTLDILRAKALLPRLMGLRRKLAA